ncbi:D-2-hydroxyacid dehydrogenase [Aureimonas pseudogalii]|uniref:Phosphoglycerate dehydrogenase-like enzyme n=1 Tax=Aureimonas pseudogalii TaxID=1744844 RepID=A0A7W6MKK9_9HYPH|nr:D-2-hydroxyacid dehydrogenase [Aureimonas pseudogalii]MBB3999060.1 phosphoglycerate dehydrogenase-like enzyme [Aureimonas pseudogalii]
MHIHIEHDSDALQLSATRLRERLVAAGIATDGLTVTENGTPTAMASAIAGAEIVFACRKLNIAAAKAAAPALDWVQVVSAGVEALLPTLPADVTLTNASGVHGDKGGEFVLTAALMLNYAIPQFVADQAARQWQPLFGGPIAGKTAVILGVGGIGKAAAAALRSRGVKVIGVTRSGSSDAKLDDSIAIDQIDAVLRQADMLISTLPLTSETEGLIDRKRLESLPKGAGVIVVGRAKVVDYAAMAGLLRAGHLGGAVLDVYPVEPLPETDPLWACPRLIMTPHCSIDDHDGYVERCLDIFVENLRRRIAGEPLTNVVDRTLGY